MLLLKSLDRAKDLKANDLKGQILKASDLKMASKLTHCK